MQPPGASASSAGQSVPVTFLTAVLNPHDAVNDPCLMHVILTGSVVMGVKLVAPGIPKCEYERGPDWPVNARA